MATKTAKKKVTKKTSAEAKVYKKRTKANEATEKNGTSVSAAAAKKTQTSVIGGVSLETVVPPIRNRTISFTIRGTSPMVQNRFGEKAAEAMRLKKAGKLTKKREPCVPENEFESAKYKTEDGQIGFPGMGLKKAMITAAHRDIGIEKVLVCKAIRFRIEDPLGVTPMEASDPIMREDLVKVGNGAADLRYRPEYRHWTAKIKFEVDEGLMNAADVLGLVDRAGFGVGLCEMRPEKKGDFGTFEVDPTVPVGGTMDTIATVKMAYRGKAEEEAAA